jgi:hypothetical protein
MRDDEYVYIARLASGGHLILLFREEPGPKEVALGSYECDGEEVLTTPFVGIQDEADERSCGIGAFFSDSEGNHTNYRLWSTPEVDLIACYRAMRVLAAAPALYDAEVVSALVACSRQAEGEGKAGAEAMIAEQVGWQFLGEVRYAVPPHLGEAFDLMRRCRLAYSVAPVLAEVDAGTVRLDGSLLGPFDLDVPPPPVDHTLAAQVLGTARPVVDAYASYPRRSIERSLLERYVLEAFRRGIFDAVLQVGVGVAIPNVWLTLALPEPLRAAAARRRWARVMEEWLGFLIGYNLASAERYGQALVEAVQEWPQRPHVVEV